MSKTQSLFKTMALPHIPQEEIIFDAPLVAGKYKVGVIGATGAVGTTVIQLLHLRCFPLGELHLYAGPASAGKRIVTPFGRLTLELLDKRHPPILDYAFMAAGSEVSEEWGWRLARRGAVVIDKSSYFRDKEYAPLVVPEINRADILTHRGIIACPNCTTIPLAMVLAPIDRLVKINRVTVVTYQSVSGQGRAGIKALENELENIEAKPSTFTQRIASNVIPWIGARGKLHSGEELKMISETRRLLKRPRLSMRVTCARVPVMVGHSMAIHMDTERRVDIPKVYSALQKMQGITLCDDPSSDNYPTPLMVAGRDDVMVGRVRRDLGSHSLALWIVSDNLRKGAATNAVQIAEAIVATL